MLNITPNKMAYSITSTANMNDLPNEDGKYPYTITHIGNIEIEPIIVWAVSFNEAHEIYFNSISK